MRHILAVYDVDPLYAARFADVVNQKETIPFEVVAFRSLERLRAFAAETPIELLLISEGVADEETEAVGAARVVVLSDGGTSGKSDYPCVYKYQSSGAIVREVMACYGEKQDEIPEIFGRGSARILGVYSPISRCLKTSFAITMGQLLAQEEKVLYLNLEEFSGLSVLLKEEYRSDLSDLLYFYSGGTYNPLRLKGVVHTFGELDYIPPVRYPEDLDQAGEEAIAGLIRTIAGEDAYGTILVDIGNSRRTAVSVMKLCQVIYMPVKEDAVSQAKLEEFEHYLDQTGNRGLKDRLKRLKLPYHASFGAGGNYLDQLLWGELGDYTRQLLRR